MAVWLQIFGKKKWDEPIGFALEDCKKSLKLFKLMFFARKFHTNISAVFYEAIFRFDH